MLNRGKEELTFKVGLERPALTFTLQASVDGLGSGVHLLSKRGSFVPTQGLRNVDVDM